MLLKQFRVAALSVSAEASVRARKLALAWKERLVGDDDNMFGALGLLHLVCAFGFVSEFSLDELVGFSVAAPTNEEDFPELCRAVGLTERVPGKDVDIFFYELMVFDILIDWGMIPLLFCWSLVFRNIRI